MMQVIFPNLYVFCFGGVSTYLESLLSRISTPLLSCVEIRFFNQLTFIIPHLLQFMHTSENFNFSAIWLNFSNDRFSLRRDSPESYSPFYMEIKCRHLNWQVSSAVQILSTLEPALSIIEKLMLHHMESSRRLSEWHNEVNHTQWRELLRPFSNVKILSVQNEFVKELSHSLHSEDKEMPLDILSNLNRVKHGSHCG
jgi:hypothetical protein